MSHEYLWYIPNTVDAGHRLDDVAGGWANLDLSTELARILEDRGWGGALIGTGWGRADTFTVATAIAARTTTFNPSPRSGPATGSRRTSPVPPPRSTTSPAGGCSSTS